MSLDDSAAAFLAGLAALGGSELDELTLDEARGVYLALAAAGAAEHDPELTVEAEQTIAGVSCRVVTPVGAESGRPVLVWFHGGGWVIGSAEMALTTARTIALGTGAVVISVDYRLAPEHPFPAGLEDALAVTRWVRLHAGDVSGDVDRVAVGGDSAGANLAAVVAAEVPGLTAQVLVYPVTDATMSYPSIERHGEGRLLTARTMRWFIDHYLAGGAAGDPTDPRVSPIFAAPASLASAPPAIVVTAGYDPLCDEGRAYADRLREAGVAVRERHWAGQIHGFFGMDPIIPEGGVALDEVVVDLRGLWSSEPQSGRRG